MLAMQQLAADIFSCSVNISSVHGPTNSPESEKKPTAYVV
jgi:hypothetical protein